MVGGKFEELHLGYARNWQGQELRIQNFVDGRHKTSEKGRSDFSRLCCRERYTPTWLMSPSKTFSLESQRLGVKNWDGWRIFHDEIVKGRHIPLFKPDSLRTYVHAALSLRIVHRNFQIPLWPFTINNLNNEDIINHHPADAQQNFHMKE